MVEDQLVKIISRAIIIYFRNGIEPIRKHIEEGGSEEGYRAEAGYPCILEYRLARCYLNGESIAGILNGPDGSNDQVIPSLIRQKLNMHNIDGALMMEEIEVSTNNHDSKGKIILRRLKRVEDFQKATNTQLVQAAVLSRGELTNIIKEYNIITSYFGVA